MVQIDADDVMLLIKIGRCHILFSVGKEQMTSEYSRVYVIKIKNVEIIIYKWKSDIMSLLGHDGVIIYSGMMMP